MPIFENMRCKPSFLLVTVPPKLAVAILVGKLKGKSAYFLRREFRSQLEQKLWGAHLWSPSYCVVSCGGAPLEIIKHYVENQRKPPSNRQVHQSKVISSKATIGVLDPPIN